MSTTSTPRRFPTSQVLFGALVLLIGVLLLLDTVGIVSTGDLLVYTPSLLVLVGVWALVQSGFRNVVGPVVLVGVAGCVQLLLLDVVTFDQLVVLWPVLIVAFGLSVILGTYRSRVRNTDDTFSSLFAAFGGVDARNTSQSFRGADLTAAFGGAELDLRDAAIVDRPVKINAVALFGGAEVIVPRDWNVRMDVLPVLGAATDERPRRGEERDEVDLVVTGFAAFGGVSVTD